jgi:hypothetical protein
LKLSYVNLLSNVGFNFNMRRCSVAWQSRTPRADGPATASDWSKPAPTRVLNPDAKAGRCKLEPVDTHVQSA